MPRSYPIPAFLSLALTGTRVQVVERMGKYLATLEPGLRILIPVLDRIKYVQSLKGTN